MFSQSTKPGPHGSNGFAGEQDQRGEYRLTARATVVLELESATPDGSQPALTETCYTQDLAATGLRVHLSRRLEKGALLPMEVWFDEEPGSYRLMAEVIWSRQRPDESWTVGLNVLDSEGCALVDWMDAVARAMSA